MKNNLKKIIIGMISFIILVAVDQITKIAAVEKLAGKTPFVIIDGVLEFCYVQNDGAAWGMLSGGRIFFIITTIIIMIGILFVYMKTPWNKKYVPLIITEILGMSGAVGNFIDRLFVGYVHDFISFTLIDFPVFNIADSYVVIAAIILIITMFFVYKDDSDFDFLKLERK